MHRKSSLATTRLLDYKQIPEWFAIRRTKLILKDKEKGNIASNFRPITCLPLMWKLCTGITGDELYNHLEK